MTETNVKPVRYMDFIGTKRTRKYADPLVSRPKTRPITKSATKPVSKPAVKPATKLAEKPVSKPASPKAPVSKLPEKSVPASRPTVASSSDDISKKASSALSRTGTKPSPFLKKYSIDKRPLSTSVPKAKDSHFEKISFLGVNSSSDSSTTKNVYEKSSPEKPEKKPEKSPVKIIDTQEKSSGLPIVVIILLTIILGAAVGAGVYFLLPK